MRENDNTLINLIFNKLSIWQWCISIFGGVIIYQISVLNQNLAISIIGGLLLLWLCEE